MNEQLDAIEIKLLELEGKIDAVFVSSEKTRKIMKWTGIITIGAILIPLLILLAIIPSFLATQSGILPPGL